MTLHGRAIIYQALVFVMAEDDILLRSHDTGGFFKAWGPRRLMNRDSSRNRWRVVPLSGHKQS